MPDSVLVRDERHSLPGRAVLQSDRTGRLYVLQESTIYPRVDRLTRPLLGVLSRVFDRPKVILSRSMWSRVNARLSC
jgi:hypothetical protein